MFLGSASVRAKVDYFNFSLCSLLLLCLFLCCINCTELFYLGKKFSNYLNNFETKLFTCEGSVAVCACGAVEGFRLGTMLGIVPQVAHNHTLYKSCSRKLYLNISYCHLLHLHNNDIHNESLHDLHTSNNINGFAQCFDTLLFCLNLIGQSS